jgi:tetratricopeptide (TPR) repeat protein
VLVAALEAPGQGGPLPAPAAQAYLDGLEALEGARYPDAVAAFTRALQHAGDDASLVLARGVAHALGGQFREALADLDRAQRLGYRGREPDLWIYVVEAMSGAQSGKHGTWFSGIPGHLVQGRDDYPTDYASHLAYQLAMPAYTARQNQASLDAPALRDARVKAGRWFASRAKARPDLGAAQGTRLERLHAEQRWEELVAALGPVLAGAPADARARFLAGEAWLNLGRPATARRELTIALQGQTDLGVAYLDRALARARLGDGQRARLDLDLALRLDPRAAQPLRARVESEIARAKGDGATPEALLAAVEQGLRTGLAWAEVIGRARAVHRAMNARRLRHDEGYQDRLRQLEEAVRANPRSADRLVELARYVTDESHGRGERVEPRRDLVVYRFTASQQQELARALGLYDRALGLAPGHVGALIGKAMALAVLKRYDESEGLVNRALALAGQNPEALRLHARYRVQRANQMSAEAAGLRMDRCSSSTSRETRSDGVYEVTRTTCHPPSAADLERARQLDAAAAQYRRNAVAAMEAAIRVTRGTVEGYLTQADLHVWRGEHDQAQQALQQAVRLDPRSLEAQEALADFYAKTGQADRAEEQQAVAVNLIHTTAAPYLRLAWGRIGKTAWQGARAALASARQLDPVDARVPAYLGVIAAAEGRTDEALVAYGTALALEEARLALDETAERAGRPLPRDPVDLGLAMQLRLTMGGLFERTGRPEAALALYRGNQALEASIVLGRRLPLMFSAMLPDPAAQPGRVPQPVHALGLLVQAHAGTGRVLAALGRTDEAARAYEAILRHAEHLGGETNVPRVGTAAEPPRNTREYGGTALPEAALWLAKHAMAKGDAVAAERYLRAATGTWPPGRNAELQELMHAIRKQMDRQRAGGDPGPGGGQPGRWEGPRNPQDVQRQRLGAQHLAARARVEPALVGVWELTPRNRFLPDRFVLTIEAGADYTLVSRNGASRRGRVDAARGMMHLVEDGGAMHTYYYEAVDRDTWKVTALDAVEYDMRRRR